MASKLSFMFWVFYGPRLWRRYASEQFEGKNFSPGYMEALPDRVITTMRTACSLTYWTSPFVGMFLYRRGFFTQDSLQSVIRYAVSVIAVYFVAYILRGLGRLGNQDYRMFISTLIEARNRPTPQSKAALAKYDFEFWAWPVDFRWNEGMQGDPKKYARRISVGTGHKHEISLLLRPLSFLVMRSFGRMMVYPGSTSLMNYLLSDMLRAGRASLVENRLGKRAKILTEDGNKIDTMFVDQRQLSENGDTLVITFEGNAGYYEMGCSGTPLDLNYSVLGWNHPGFAGSSGKPWPYQEQKAADAVMQYAIYGLGFMPRDIVLFAWSIGGYTATWLAKTYPDVKFVILDATFDDIVPLALSKMPSSWAGLVKASLRSYMNLNIADQLVEYLGPVLMIRRTRDEIISTETPPTGLPVIASNRGNNLLLKFLQSRYPAIVDEETLPAMIEFLSKDTHRQVTMLEEAEVVYHSCNKFLAEHPNNTDIKLNLGTSGALKMKLALFLITVHMENFDSTHCSPLPGQYFHKPWTRPGLSFNR